MPLSEHPPLPVIHTGSHRPAANSHWNVRRGVWMSGLASIAVFVLGGLYAVPAATSSPDYALLATPGALVAASAPTTTTTASTTTTTTTSTTTTTVATPTPAPAPAPTSAPVVLAATPPAPAAPVLPAVGQATVWGCSAALAYLSAYAAPGFTLDCPGYAEGHEAMTCIHGTPEFPDACPNGPTIAISDPCPQAYMNESANSWNLTGQLSVEQAKFGVSYADIDPFGACP